MESRGYCSAYIRHNSFNPVSVCLSETPAQAVPNPDSPKRLSCSLDATHQYEVLCGAEEEEALVSSVCRQVVDEAHRLPEIAPAENRQ